MARTVYLDVPDGQEELYYKGLQSGDRFTFPRITRKSAFFSRYKKLKLTAKSYLPTIGALWQNFTNEQKANWKAVDPYEHPNGWRAFVADQSKRIKFGHAGTATPNEYHQDMVGALVIEAPAEEIEIAQYHPAQYYVYQKVQGKKAMYNPVSVEEYLTLPFEISLNYKSNLVSTGEGSFAKFYAQVRHYYQGQNLDKNLEIDLDLQTDWKSDSAILSSALGEVAGYTLFIHLYKMTGLFLFDNIKAEHTSQNWLRDTRCKDISQGFTKAFYQVPRNWGAVTVPPGTDFDSIYPT